jgi:hypothetical protein
MNHRDRETLGQLLDHLWDGRRGDRTAIPTPRGELTPQQRDYLAAAMRIVAGTEGPNLPNPWPRNMLHKIGTPQAAYTEPTHWARRLITRLKTHL